MIHPFEREQLGVSADLDDALVDHGDLVGVLDSGHPVGDGNRGAGLLFVQLVQSCLHYLAGSVVRAIRSFVRCLMKQSQPPSRGHFGKHAIGLLEGGKTRDGCGCKRCIFCRRHR